MLTAAGIHAERRAARSGAERGRPPRRPRRRSQLQSWRQRLEGSPAGPAAGLIPRLFRASSADPQQRLEIMGAGEIEPVFLWTRDRCAQDDIPDAPLRAVRLDDDHVIAFATHEQNRAFLGPNLGALKRDCRVVLAGWHSDRPEDYSDRVWIASTWSEDGRTIFALGHDEYQAHRHPGRCHFATYAECWWNSIVLLRSRDGGRSFSRVGDRPVATISKFGRTSIRAIAAASMSRAIS